MEKATSPYIKEALNFFIKKLDNNWASDVLKRVRTLSFSYKNESIVLEKKQNYTVLANSFSAIAQFVREHSYWKLKTTTKIHHINILEKIRENAFQELLDSIDLANATFETKNLIKPKVKLQNMSLDLVLRYA